MPGKPEGMSDELLTSPLAEAASVEPASLAGDPDRAVAAHPLNPTRGKRWRVMLIVLGLVASGVTGVAWHYLHRARALVDYAPAMTLAYIEVSDVSGVLDELRRTRAWHTLRPFLPDAAVAPLPSLLNSQIALVLTGFEVEQERLTPHWALLVRPPGGTAAATAASQQMESLARKLFGTLTTEIVEEQGVTITRYRDSERRQTLIWGVLDGTLVLANRDESFRSLKETAQKRQPSLGETSTFQSLRRVVDRHSPIIGFVSGEALQSLLERRATLSPSPPRTSPLVSEFLQTVTSPLSLTLAFAVDVEGDEVITRSILGLDPDASAQLASVVNGQTDIKSLAFIPPDAHRIAIYRFGDLQGVVRAVEGLLRERLSPVAQIVLRELIGRMKQSLGWTASDTIVDALGNEITVVERDGERLLLVETRQKAKLAALIGKYLRQSGEPIGEDEHRGYIIFSAGKRSERAFCFVEDYLVIGPKPEIEALLDRRGRQPNADHTRVASLLQQRARGAFEVTISRDHSEVTQAILTIQNLVASADGTSPPDSEALQRAVGQLPPEMRFSHWRREGIYSESRSPLGPFSLILSMIEGERIARSP